MSGVEKSAYTDFMKQCLKSGKSMKECALEWKEKQKTEAEKQDKYPSPGEKYPNIPAGSFSKIFSMLDKLIKGAKDEDLKKALQSIKAALSHVVGGSYPYPEPEKKAEEHDSVIPKDVVQDLESDLEQIRSEVAAKKEKELLAEITKRDKEIEELKKGLKEIKDLLETKVPIRKGVVAEPEKRPEKDGLEEITKSKEFKEAYPGDRLRLLLKKALKN